MGEQEDDGKPYRIHDGKQTAKHFSPILIMRLALDKSPRGYNDQHVAHTGNTRAEKRGPMLQRHRRKGGKMRESNAAKGTKRNSAHASQKIPACMSQEGRYGASPAVITVGDHAPDRGEQYGGKRDHGNEHAHKKTRSRDRECAQYEREMEDVGGDLPQPLGNPQTRKPPILKKGGKFGKRGGEERHKRKCKIQNSKTKMEVFRPVLAGPNYFEI